MRSGTLYHATTLGAASNHTCISQTSWYMGYVAETVRRFFHPAAIDEMLSTFIPMIDGTSLSVSLYTFNNSAQVFELILRDTEDTRRPILPAKLPAALPPSILPATHVQTLGVDQLVHVGRTHAAIPSQNCRDACRSHR